MIQYYKNLTVESLFYINEKGLVCLEEWKDIVGYEGFYQVSNLGRAKSFKKRKIKILRQNFDDKKYLMIRLYKNNKGKTRRIGQLVSESFLNHIPCGYKLVVEHKNHIRYDNRLENLEIITQRKNADRRHLPSSSKYVGVHWSNRDNIWKTSIVHNKKTIFLGNFTDELKASECYQNALKIIQEGGEIEKKQKSSKYKGVSWYEKQNKWVSRITINGKQNNLGYFDTEEEASEYYQNALKSTKDRTEILVKRKEKTSIYDGVHFDKSRNKWSASIVVNKKRKYIGRFNTEIEAHNAYQAKLSSILQ
jgi:hypothetical protein